jgi:hypothetical protein
MAPAQLAGHSVEGAGCAQSGSVERPPYFQQIAAKHVRLIKLDVADLFESSNVCRRDLIEIRSVDWNNPCSW